MAAASRGQGLQTHFLLLALYAGWALALEPQWWVSIDAGQQRQYFEHAYRSQEALSAKGFGDNFLEAEGVFDITRRSFSRQRYSSVLVDVGCNAGNALAAMVATFGAVRAEPLTMWAFEPNPETFAYLEQGLLKEHKLGQHHQIQLMQAAVSDRAGTAPFFHRGAGDLLAGLVQHPDRELWPSAHSEDTEIRVRVVTLDEVFGRGTHIHLLKVDAEGYDPFVLRGARALLASRRLKFVVFEYDEAWKVAGHNLTLQAAAQELYTQGYLCFFMTKAALLPLYGAWWSRVYESIPWGNVFCGHKDDHDLFDAYLAHGVSNNFTVAFALSSLRSWLPSLGWR